MIIDATNLILGRLASMAAKKAMLGVNVDIINCEKAVVSGSRADVLAKFFTKRRRATIRRGPFISRMPDRFIRRIIRGMIPYKYEKGERAFEKVMCYVGVPKGFEGKKFETFEKADAVKRQTKKFITVGEVCKELGARI